MKPELMLDSCEKHNVIICHTQTVTIWPSTEIAFLCTTLDPNITVHSLQDICDFLVAESLFAGAHKMILAAPFL